MIGSAADRGEGEGRGMFRRFAIKLKSITSEFIYFNNSQTFFFSHEDDLLFYNWTITNPHSWTTYIIS